MGNLYSSATKVSGRVRELLTDASFLILYIYSKTYLMHHLYYERDGNYFYEAWQYHRLKKAGVSVREI